MAKREKRLKRQEESLLKQVEKHRVKAESLKGDKDTTHDYWLEEAKRFEEQAKKRAEMLKKLKKRRK